MMRGRLYYDRTLPPEVIDAFRDGGSLAWLSKRLYEVPGLGPLAHIEFRKDRRAERHGSVTLYLGRTTPLRFRYRGNGLYDLDAHAKYKKLSSMVFRGTMNEADFDEIKGHFEKHMTKVAAAFGNDLSAAFIEKEGAIHGALMSRYGHRHKEGDPFTGIDTEVVFEFPSPSTKEHFEAKMASIVKLPEGVEMPRELDVLGILANGDIGIVEIQEKDKEGKLDLAGAVGQVAAHVYRFREHARLRSSKPVEVLTQLRAQKVAAGFLPAHVEKITARDTFVPVVAAPDAREDWKDIWLRETETVRRENAELLTGLRFWHLAGEGENVGQILDDVPAG